MTVPNLLQKLQHQKTDNLFTYSAVVVDNDANKTAEATVADLRKTSLVRIDYFNEPEQNIALARNKAVENSHGTHIAFLDDDEFPVPDWLNLYKTVHHFKSDVVLGPVRPHYPDNTPKWLIKSKLCERPEYKTGTIMHWGATRTGNVLFDKQVFENRENRFGREFGRTGGEDIEFFKKIAAAGKTFVWCNEAPAYEIVSQERWTKDFYKQRSLRIGGLVGEKIRGQENIFVRAFFIIKNVTWITVMGIFLPFSILLGEHLYMKAITKIMYSFGLISGFMDHPMIRNRNE